MSPFNQPKGMVAYGDIGVMLIQMVQEMLYKLVTQLKVKNT